MREQGHTLQVERGRPHFRGQQWRTRMKLPLVLVCSLAAAAIACAGNASAQKSSSAYSTSQNRTVYDSRAADRAEAYWSFAPAPGASPLAPGASGVSSFGQVN